jgi:hypothetical protein
MGKALDVNCVLTIEFEGVGFRLCDHGLANEEARCLRATAITGEGDLMDKVIEENLMAVLKREGLQPMPGDLEQFSSIIELYMENLKQLHSVNLGADELAPVFRPDWTSK